MKRLTVSSLALPPFDASSCVSCLLACLTNFAALGSDRLGRAGHVRRGST